MPDVTEQAEVVETPQATEEVAESTTQESEDNVSEDVQNTSDEPERKGNLAEALRQERELRRQTEARYQQALSDPNFVYEQAKRLGLTEEEAQDAAEAASSGQPTLRQPQVDIAAVVSQQVEAKLDYKEAVREFPELESDRELKAWAAALVDGGKTHLQAARIIQKKLGLTKQSAKAEGISQAKNEITEKERATTAPLTSAGNVEAVEEADLRRRMRSYDKKTQEQAFIENIMRRDQAKRK